MRFLLFLTIFLVAIPAFAADYYVSPSGSGSTCSEASPCAITYALANASAGDTWFLRGGDYYFPETAGYEFPPSGYSFANSGSSGSPITLKAYAGETPVFVGDRGWAANEMVVMLSNASNTYITIDGITFAAYQDANGTGTRRTPVLSLYSATDTPLNIIVKNCTFVGSTITIQDNHHMIKIGGGGTSQYGSHVAIQNNIFTGLVADSSNSDPHGIACIMTYGYRGDSTDPNNIDIYNNTFVDVGNGVYFKGNNNPANNIDIYNNFFNGVEGGVIFGTNGPDYIDVHNNIIALSRTSGSTSRLIAGVDANSYQQASDNNSVYNNTIYSTDTQTNASVGIYGQNFNGDIYNNIIQLGIVGNTTGTGVGYFYQSSTLTALNNNNFSTEPFYFYAEASAYANIANLEGSSIVSGTSNFCSSTSPCNNIATASTFVNTSGNMSAADDFALSEASAGYQAGSDGTDIGADVSLVGASITPPGADTTAPTVDSFVLPATATSLTVDIGAFTASDDTAVTGYCVVLVDDSSGCSWSGSAQTQVIFSSDGVQTAYAFARDAALNVSDSASDSVTITLPMAQNVSRAGGNYNVQ